MFHVSKELIAHLELTEILDPFLFENHKDIVNAWFFIYYDLSQTYLEECFNKPKLAALSGVKEAQDYLDLSEQATKKLRLKYNLTSEEQKQ